MSVPAVTCDYVGSAPRADACRYQQFRQEFCLLERSVAEAEDHMTKFLCELKTVDWLTSFIPKLQRGSSPTPSEYSHVSRRGRFVYLFDA